MFYKFVSVFALIFFLQLFSNGCGEPTAEVQIVNSTVIIETTTATVISNDNANRTEIKNKTSPQILLPPAVRMLLAKLSESDNEFGHVEVRKGAFLFWWLYYADGTKEDAFTKPLVIWIQGGPSIPGSGLGNFIEIGPLTLNLKTRPYSWVKGKNVLLVDSPVGTGFSYVQSGDLYCKTDKDVAADLIQLMKSLIRKFPGLRQTPTHIFSQSYGTKIASYFAYYLSKDIESGDVEMNLKTVALGGSWVDTIETTTHTAEFLYQMGFLDKREYNELRDKVNNLTTMIDRKEYREAYKYRLEIYSNHQTFNGYNIFKPNVDSVVSQITSLMNGIVSLYLGPLFMRINWSFLNLSVMDGLSSEFMKPARHVVEKILNETNIRVVVYNGDLDAVTPMAGAVSWVHNLSWPGREGFYNAKRRPLLGQQNGYFKEHERLSLWWILKAGHWIPNDNPGAMDQVLQYIVHDNKEMFLEGSSSGNKTTEI